MRCQTLFTLLTSHRTQHIIKGMLQILQVLFLCDKAQLLLLQSSIFQGNGRFQFNAFVYFCLLLVVQLAVGNIKAFQRCLGQLNAHFLVFLFYLKIFLCFFSLAF